MGTVLWGSHGDDPVTEIHLSAGTRLRLASGPAPLGKKSAEPHRSKGPLGNTSWATRESEILDVRCQCLVSSLVFSEITKETREAALHSDVFKVQKARECSLSALTRCLPVLSKSTVSAIPISYLLPSSQCYLPVPKHFRVLHGLQRPLVPHTSVPYFSIFPRTAQFFLVPSRCAHFSLFSTTPHSSFHSFNR